MKRFEVEGHAPSFLPKGDWELVWNDEFDGTELDRTKWDLDLIIGENLAMHTPIRALCLTETAILSCTAPKGTVVTFHRSCKRDQTPLTCP